MGGSAGGATRPLIQACRVSLQKARTLSLSKGSCNHQKHCTPAAHSGRADELGYVRMNNTISNNSPGYHSGTPEPVGAGSVSRNVGEGSRVHMGMPYNGADTS